ncbi:MULTISPECIES: DUF262 domain-containing protein [unclassified Bradyrhizobium]|uniref:DUF262 domain-containing protein n=1 Tax=unclassified Bradyrhizobium TaxID=2631580 RepID=UPI002916572C|nr:MULTISPECIES: DUF262 domain-containing protein [unclassified Bradyrhizobium]
MKKPKVPADISEAAKLAAEQQILEQSKRIDFYLTEYSVEILANKMKEGDFKVPPYQREFVWEPERQSRFIESVIMGLPIPFLFFWEMGDGRLEIVDGSQRLRTLQEFILGDLRLGDLESLPTVSNFRFVDLPESRQRKIKNRSIRGIVLNEHADEQARFDMFERINTGSKVAEAPEVRRGALAGPFMALIIKLAELPAFTALAPISEKLRKQREHEELVTRFFAYSDGLEGYKDRPSEFLFNYVKKMNPIFEASPQLADEYRQRFERMLDFVGATFPNGFRRTPKGTATPRARFEAISLGSHLALQANPQLSSQTPDIRGWIDGDEFSGITGGDGANAIGRLQRRMNFVRDKLVGA